MSKSLLIVESPSKAKTISKYLGKDFTVLATSGHIKNLPAFKLGINIDKGFEPEYVTIEGKNKVIKSLRENAKISDHIFIATDPDREGEAIANHVAMEISDSLNNKIHRVLFNEITKEAVQAEIKNPHSINLNLVEAQKARRILDRFVGFMVSPFLWKVIYRGLSAGRVQSVALRLICDRENEVVNFKEVEYWKLIAKLKYSDLPVFEAKLIKVGKKEAKISSREEADKIIDAAKKSRFIVKSLVKKEIKKRPYPPFITSTLQQEAVKRFGMSTKRVMSIAQKLYEGVELGKEGNVSLVTYIRTDSVRVSQSAVNSIRKYIETKYGHDQLVTAQRVFKNKKRAQDAHEAIRPSYSNRPPDSVIGFLTKDEYKIYELIWNRFVATQMKDALYDQVTCDIYADDYLFRASDLIMKFSGFLKVFREIDDEENAKHQTIPAKLKVGDELNLEDLTGTQHFTQPPPRYNESSLVKEMDAKGIGRPSTYAVIIGTLFDRKYIERDKKALKSTELGIDVNKILVKNLSDLFNVEFSAQMEDKLDLIESGEKESVDVIREFYEPFNEYMQKLNKMKSEIRKEIEEVTDINCEKCGSKMVIKWGRSGKFYACSDFPKCKSTKPLMEREKPEETEIDCEKCGSKMVVKKGKFGEFLACSNYPDCKNTKPIALAKCPFKDCTGDIVKRRGKKSWFYGCTKYPDCNFISRYHVENKDCEKCENNYLERKTNKSGLEYLQCPKCKSTFKINP
ncbi:type I DNA topoisomerase [candidate division KSB1 bacterium]